MILNILLDCFHRLLFFSTGVQKKKECVFFSVFCVTLSLPVKTLLFVFHSRHRIWLLGLCFRAALQSMYLWQNFLLFLEKCLQHLLVPLDRSYIVKMLWNSQKWTDTEFQHYLHGLLSTYVVTAYSDVIPCCSCEWAVEPWAQNPLFLPGKIRPCGQKNAQPPLQNIACCSQLEQQQSPGTLCSSLLVPSCVPVPPWHRPERHRTRGAGMFPQSIYYCHRARQTFVANSNCMLVSKRKSYLKRLYPKKSDVSFQTLFQMLNYHYSKKKASGLQ